MVNNAIHYPSSCTCSFGLGVIVILVKEGFPDAVVDFEQYGKRRHDALRINALAKGEVKEV